MTKFSGDALDLVTLFTMWLQAQQFVSIVKWHKTLFCIQIYHARIVKFVVLITEIKSRLSSHRTYFFLSFTD